MSKINEFNFTSISSDDTLFDFDVIISKIRRTNDIGRNEFINKVRTHFLNKYPELSDEEQSSVVARFMMDQMDYKKFVETVDILGAKMTLNIIV